MRNAYNEFIELMEYIGMSDSDTLVELITNYMGTDELSDFNEYIRKEFDM